VTERSAARHRATSFLLIAPLEDDGDSWVLDLEDLDLYDERLPCKRMVIVQYGSRI
jgi:hypothetical protein